MKLEYGGYLCEFGSTSWSQSRSTRWSEFTGVPLFENHVWTVWGYLRGDNVADLSAKMQAMEAAFTQHGGNLRILNNGSETAHKLLSGDTINGTRVQKFQWMRGSPPATEYVNRRSFMLVVGGEKKITRSGLVSWRETLQFYGNGGPVYRWRPSLFGIPQPQTVQFASTVNVIQRGHAVGISDYPQIPTALWGQPYLKNERVNHGGTTPQRLGNDPFGFAVNWMYAYEGLAFSGVPTLPS